VASLRDESAAGKREVPESIPNAALLEQVLERTNLQRALKQVRQNQGAPGIDGMTVDELPGYLRDHWLEIRAQLVAGSYGPQPVRRVEVPKDDGKGVRLLGVPTVTDNCTR
jgi:retron-type reverse transcriptase